MSKALLLLGIFQLASWAAPIEVRKDNEGVIHYVEEVVTPEPVKETLLKQTAWRIASDRSVAPTEGLSEQVDAVEVLLDKVVNLGKKCWAVIESGRPVVNVSSLYANALPAGVRSSELEGFSPLQFRSFRHTGVNLYGVTVYDVTYTLAHRYGGSYQGRGAYLESATVLPQEVQVVWGYSVDLKVEEVSTVNLGNRENPIASIAMQTQLRVKTVLQDLQLNHLHEFRGDSAQVSSTELP